MGRVKRRTADDQVGKEGSGFEGHYGVLWCGGRLKTWQEARKRQVGDSTQCQAPAPTAYPTPEYTTRYTIYTYTCHNAYPNAWSNPISILISPSLCNIAQSNSVIIVGTVEGIHPHSPSLPQAGHRRPASVRWAPRRHVPPLLAR